MPSCTPYHWPGTKIITFESLLIFLRLRLSLHISVARYGFHGASHQYVVTRLGSVLAPGARLVSAHLGAGASLAAAVTGEEASRDTSMGFSPLSGLVMATRSGDIDPSVVPYISHQLQLSADDVLNALNKQSGFLGIAGTSDSRYALKVVLVDL